MMTRKHFEALAAALVESRRACGSREQVEQWRRDVEAISLVMSKYAEWDVVTNRTRFLKACGVEESR